MASHCAKMITILEVWEGEERLLAVSEQQAEQHLLRLVRSFVRSPSQEQDLASLSLLGFLKLLFLWVAP